MQDFFHQQYECKSIIQFVWWSCFWPDPRLSGGPWWGMGWEVTISFPYFGPFLLFGVICWLRIVLFQAESRIARVASGFFIWGWWIRRCRGTANPTASKKWKSPKINIPHNHKLLVQKKTSGSFQKENSWTSQIHNKTWTFQMFGCQMLPFRWKNSPSLRS